MNIFHHYCMPGFTNCYVLGNDKKDAIMIDPGSITTDVTNFIEKDHYYFRGALLTHNHKNHINGLRTLKRIYDFDIYAANQNVLEHKAILVKDGSDFDVGSFHVQVFSVPGHSIDSVVFKINNILFTGDVLSAGLIGNTDSSYSAMRQIAMIQNKLFTLHGNLVIFPGHGPPTSLDIERKFNAEIGTFQQKRDISRRSEYNLDMIDVQI
ncbi:MAG: hypothetical protein Ta2G_12260 [Termitinemataceae bacterium]|nr:MAG: hypothetical protein Ta2G_12260 [Termitinemataceae bacterium]